jgi:hypothetical protein
MDDQGKIAMNKEVWIISEADEIYIGKVFNILKGKTIFVPFLEMLKETIKQMIHDECFDDDSISFTIQLR